MNNEVADYWLRLVICFLSAFREPVARENEEVLLSLSSASGFFFLDFLSQLSKSLVFKVGTVAALEGRAGERARRWKALGRSRGWGDKRHQDVAKIFLLLGRGELGGTGGPLEMWSERQKGGLKVWEPLV